MTHRRRNFTRETKRAAHERSGGVCECHRIPNFPAPVCGARLTSGNIFYEHINQDWIGGSNDLDNCATLSKTCWRIKTDQVDQPVIAKTKRMGDQHIGAHTPAQRPLPFGRTDRLKKKIGQHGANVVFRDSGKPVEFGRRR